jgi:hypothetical protein
MNTVTTLTTVLDAITATNTPADIDVSYAKKATLTFTEGGVVNNRSGVLTVTGSWDGTNYYALNMLVDNVVNDNTHHLTRVSSKTRAAAGTDLLSLDLKSFPVKSIKILVTISDGALPTGNFTVKLLTED